MAKPKILKSVFNNVINDAVQKDLIWDAKNDPASIEKKLCDELEIKSNKVLVAYAKFVPFVPTGLDILVEVNGVPTLVCGNLGMFIQNIQNYSEVPYVYVKKSDKTKVVTYLKNYSR